MEKLLTLIIPTYNMEKYLDHCLTSLIIDDKDLLAQLEVLVVIDGAKDKSSEIAHRYQDALPKTFRVIDKENGNYGSCVNRGLKEASGKYIKVLDADDSFDTKVFQSYLNLLKKTDVDMILTPFYYVNEGGKRTNYVTYSLPESDALTFEQVTPALLKQSIQMHAVTYKTSCVRSINYVQTEGISYTDQEWVFTPLSAVSIIAFFNKPIYLYLWGRAGQTMDENVIKKSLSHNIACARKILTDYTSFPKFEPAKQKIIDYKTRQTLEGPYHSFLIRFPDLDRKDLKDYEDFLTKLNPNLLEQTNSFALRGSSYRYIQEWHKNKNVKIPKFTKKKAEFITKIFGKLKRLYQRTLSHLT